MLFSSLPSYSHLKNHYEKIKDIHLNDLFNSDNKRFETFSIKFDDLFLDYSKNKINSETIELLLKLAHEANLKNNIHDMFSGNKINFTEERAVLHTALRNQSNREVFVDGKDVMPDVRNVLNKIKSFSDKLHSGEWKGYTGGKIDTIVNIGIGGSDLGPRMVCEALKKYSVHGMNVHFVSNVDGADISNILNKINPDTTLFIIASKTFTTQETITNANTAKNWFLDNTGNNTENVKKHFIALSTNKEKVIEFGIDPENMFEFWDWVGGRYSMWSAIGMSISLYLGFDNFVKLLEGAYEMDEHFRTVPFEKNMPVILGLLGIWYTNFFNAASHAVIPYDNYLVKFSEFLQQLDMESNGKYITKSGKKVDYKTGPIIWGTAGTNSQHSFFQLIHQGTQLIPVDFLAAINPLDNVGDHHSKLLSNFFAQTEALMKGKDENEVIDEFEAAGKTKEEYSHLINHKVFEGDKPTNSILYDKLTPKTLGKLIAMYEHKVFVQGVLWNINSFDQWGVELGKQLAKKILPELESDDRINSHDNSTNGLINYYKENKG